MILKEVEGNMINCSINLVHHLPGRLRLKTSRPPIKIENMVKEISSHSGVENITFNPVSRSILVYYNPSEIDAVEIMLRIAIYFSVEFGMIPINLIVEKSKTVFSRIDNYTLMSLFLSWISRMIDTKPGIYRILNYNAGLSTLLSVVKHAVNETRSSGTPHPEAVSIIYLLGEFSKNNILLASTLTWIATFARHLVSIDSDNVTIQAFKVSGGRENESYYDVAVKEFNPLGGGYTSIEFLEDIIRHVLGVVGHNRSSMMNRIKNISLKHGDILEGLKYKEEMIFLRL